MTTTDTVTLSLPEALEPPWAQLPPRALGEGTTPSLCVCVRRQRVALRFDVRTDREMEYHFKHDACLVADALFIGVGHRAFAVALPDGAAREHHLDDYFGYLRALDEGVLIASGRSLYRLDLDGAVRWHSRDLAVDGVLIDQVVDGQVRGYAQLDPPDAWTRFVVDLATGRAC